MSDLISRQDVIKAVLGSNLSACMVYGRSEEGMATAKELIQAIKNLPSAEPEIIRCKNCIWFDRYTDGIEKYQWDGFCAEWARNTYENWYCGRAERR